MAIRILLVEDREDDVLLVKRHLAKASIQAEWRWVDSEVGYLAALDENYWDLVLSDANLVGYSGLQALKSLRERDADLPFILMSGEHGEEIAVEAMRMGANDFVLKSNLSRLAPAITREVKEFAIRKDHREVQEAQRLLYAAMEHVPDLVLITDRQGSIRYANSAVEQISGYDRSEIMDQNPRIFKSDKHDTQFYRNLWETILQGHTWRGRLVNKRKDGTLWDGEASISPVLDGQGVIHAFVCAIRDISHEQELRNQLEQAQRLESIGLLAGGIAHDFNNALMPILVTAELGGLRIDTDPGSRRDFELILKSASRARALVRQILAFSRKSEHESVPLELHLIVRESLKLIRSVLPTSLRLEEHIDQTSTFVKGDATQLHQVILNLLTNASHAMKHTMGTLGIALEVWDYPDPFACTAGGMLPGGRYLCLKISDTGVGMDQETINKIFLPFFTTKGSGEGTGLGLSIAHGIVRDMGGGIQVDSEVGKGSTFKVFLPVFESGVVMAEGLPMSCRRPLCVLLVDDEQEILNGLAFALRGMGYHVQAASSPKEALRVFGISPDAFHVLLTDLNMPELSGVDLAQAIWSMRPGLPAVLMSGFSDALDIDRARELGFACILEKPKSAIEVAAILESAVPDK